MYRNSSNAAAPAFFLSTGGIALVTLASGLVGYVAQPSLTGLKGVFGAAMLGMGTSTLTVMHASLGLAVGAAIGGLFGAIVGNRAKQGAVALGLVCSLGTGLWHLPASYRHSRNLVVYGTAPRPAPAVVAPR